MSFNKRACVGNTTEFRAAIEVQQDLAQSSALHSEIVWDTLGPDQSDLLITKLDCMFPYDGNAYTLKVDIRKKNKHNANVKSVKSGLFRNIWNQRKYTNGALLYSIIYIIVSPQLTMEEAKISHNYTIHPVFRTRRCLNVNSSAGCCMIFIDEKSRVYQNWNDFLKNNELPCGTMIAPKNGCYSLDKDNKVELEYSLTPAYSYKTLSTMDNIISAASVAGQTATFIHPLFTLITIGTKSYETVRNYQKMSDKVTRGATTSHHANLSLATDIISLTSSVATFGAYMKVRTGGELSVAAGVSIQTINGVAAAVNGTKLLITAYDLFTRYFIDEEQLDFGDLLAFGSSLILFTNSINNIAITSKMTKVGGNTLRSLVQSNIRAGLLFVSDEVTRRVGQGCGIFDLLRLFNDIPCKDVLYNMHTVYKNLSPQSGFLTTLSVLGAAAMEVIPGLLVQIASKEITELDLNELLKHYGSQFVQNISSCHNFIDVLNCMGQYFSLATVEFLLNQTRSFIESTFDAFDSLQKPSITTEIILYKMFCNVIKNYKNYTYEFLNEKKDEILSYIINFFKSLNPISTDTNTKKYDCDVCGGYYYL